MRSPERSADEFDYVIVGGGTAGSVLAARLSQDPDMRVCVLEAGGPARHVFTHVPAGFIHILHNPAYTWSFSSEPQAELGGRRIAATQGRTLGGSSAINGMIYNRCQPADYDNWAQAGNPGWSAAEVLPYFRRSEATACGDDRYRGREGPLVVSEGRWRHPLCDAFISAAVAAGIPRNPDYNGASQVGVGYTQRTIDGRWRQSSATAFLRHARTRSTLDVLTHARAEAILFKERRACGVRYVRGVNGSGELHEVRARREVIVCAGALNSPRLLQVSGVGAPSHLDAIGVPVVRDLEGVGENLRDHFCARLVYRARNVRTINELSRGPRLAGEVLKWLMGRPSILSLSPSVAYLLWKSDEILDAPDLQAVFAPASYKSGIVGELDRIPGFTLGFYQQRPASVGHVRARSRDTFAEPSIQPNYLAAAEDQRALVAGLRLGRRLIGSAALAPYLDDEELPGRELGSDDDLLGYARDYGSTVYHFAGSCRMGPASDRLAVVDNELRVHGLMGLRVVDASIMPNITSGNTATPVMMIAEKAADMMRGRAPLGKAG